MIFFKAWFALRSLAFLSLEWVVYAYKRIILREFVDPTYLDSWLGREGVRFSNFMFSFLKVDFEIENPEMLDKIDWHRNVFITGNHQSYMDIPAIYLSVQKHLIFIAKKDLSKIPILSYWLREMGSVLLDRKKRNAGLEVAKILKERTRVFNLVAFCEGKRSKNGKIENLKSGIFRYADALDGVLVPLVIKGTQETWEGRKKISQRHKIKVRILDPIDFRKLEEQGKTFQNVRHELQVFYRKEFEGRSFK